MGLLYSIVVGLIAGWLAGQVMRGGGYGVLMDIVLGILGGVVGGWLFGAARHLAGRRPDRRDLRVIRRRRDPRRDHPHAEESLTRRKSSTTELTEKSTEVTEPSWFL